MPLRDNLCPNDLRSSPLLRATREFYFGRLSEDMYVDARDACAGFVRRLRWHKRRPVGLVSKIEGISDDHPLNPRCLFDLSRLCGVVSNHAERRQSFIHTLKLWRERGMTSGSPKRYSP